jgi:8-oxo-dGTP pyrophosphatase MutT (NUDIX family)
MEMHAELAAFLAQHTPIAVETVLWAGGAMPLRLTSYLISELPPVALVTSVRCVLLHGALVQVVRDPDSTHILPGGRCEPGESLDQTLRREVLEETGCTVGTATLIGLRHFRHLAPAPPNYRYHYPDFLQLVYAARVLAIDPAARELDGYEIEASFQPIAALPPLARSEQLFLAAALSRL